MQERTKSITPAVLLALTGLMLNLIAYYPGFLSPDALSIYEQSLSQQYRDWHPPVMAWVWHLLNLVYTGPQPMLILQLALFWSGFYFLATSWFSTLRRYLLLFFIFLLAPFIQNFLGFIGKDVQMALSWLFSFAVIAKADWYQRRMTPAEALLAILFIAYGIFVRINALPGALPLLFFWWNNFLGWPARRKKLLATTAASLLFIIVCQEILNKSLQPTHEYPEYKLYLHDLSGIYVQSGKSYFPVFIQQYPGFDTAYLKTHYTPATFDDLYWNAAKKISFPVMDDASILVMRAAWITAISDHPLTYLVNRWNGFLYFIRLRERSGFVAFHPEISRNSFGLKFTGNYISDFFLWLTRLQTGMPYMRPWFWLLLNLIFLPAAWKLNPGKKKNLIRVLCFSSILYQLPQFFIFQVDTEFRYFYWNCLALTISGLLLFSEWSPSLLKRKTQAFSGIFV